MAGMAKRSQVIGVPKTTKGDRHNMVNLLSTTTTKRTHSIVAKLNHPASAPTRRPPNHFSAREITAPGSETRSNHAVAPSTDSISGVGPNGVGKALHLPPRGWADDRMGHSMFTCHAHPVAASLSTMRSNLPLHLDCGNPSWTLISPHCLQDGHGSATPVNLFTRVCHSCCCPNSGF